jgi:hypothetical protein
MREATERMKTADFEFDIPQSSAAERLAAIRSPSPLRCADNAPS